MELTVKTPWTKELSKDFDQYLIKDEKGRIRARVYASDYFGLDAAEFVKTADLICLLGAFNSL